MKHSTALRGTGSLVDATRKDVHRNVVEPEVYRNVVGTRDETVTVSGRAVVAKYNQFDHVAVRWVGSDNLRECRGSRPYCRFDGGGECRERCIRSRRNSERLRRPVVVDKLVVDSGYNNHWEFRGRVAS